MTPNRRIILVVCIMAVQTCAKAFARPHQRVLPTAAAFVASRRGGPMACHHVITANNLIVRSASNGSTTTSNSSSSSSSSTNTATTKQESALSSKEKGSSPPVPLYCSQGLFAVDKPLDWTSQDVVAYLRGMLERDSRSRGAKPQKLGRKRSIKVGHGGTLDPLATGVLVIGVGSGTKELQSYLQGSKRYRAGLELGYETTTLDLDGNVTKTASFDHVTLESMQAVVSNFVGTIEQLPPIFSAIRKDGKRLYEQARQGATAEELQIEPREVKVYDLALENTQHFPPKLDINVSCGGGTYVRSLVRDLGYAVDCVATTTSLRRTQQGPFGEKDCLSRDDWTVDNIYAAIDRFNAQKSGQ